MTAIAEYSNQLEVSTSQPRGGKAHILLVLVSSPLSRFKLAPARDKREGVYWVHYPLHKKKSNVL
jgi:hypothetical protein